MYRVRVQFAAAATLLYALSAVPARAAVVTLDSQERVIEAHIALVYGGGPPLGGVSYSDRVERASDFGRRSDEADAAFDSVPIDGV